MQLLTGGWIDHRFCCLWHPWHVKGTARLLYSGMSLGWPEKSFRINYNTYLFFIYSDIIYIMTSNCRYTQILQLDQSSLKLTLLRSVKASQTVGQACTTRSASLEKALSGWKWLDLEMLTVYRQISWHPMNILDIYIIWCMMMYVLFGIYMGKHNDHNMITYKKLLDTLHGLVSEGLNPSRNTLARIDRSRCQSLLGPGERL